MMSADLPAPVALPVGGEPDPPSAPDIVDRTELARRLDLHPRTIQRMVDRGELPRPCLSAGGRPRWLWSYVVEHCRKRHQREEELDRRRRRKLQ
jgi:hypothetical protein